MIGPPGYPSPSSFATLSYASPAASSRVRPISRYIPGCVDEIEAGVTARHDEHDRRRRNLAVLEPQRFDVPGQMIDRDQRLARPPTPRSSRTRRRPAASRSGPGPA